MPDPTPSIHNDASPREEGRVMKYIPVREATDAQRVAMVKDIFSTVTPRYDFLNHFLSLRRDIAWRRFTIRRMSFGRTMRFLDVATGTADLAIGAALRYPAITVAGVDFSAEMLEAGRPKVTGIGLSDRVRLMRADALALPFADGSFDVAGIAFGIRNIPDKARALKEMTRVVVPGGQVMVLEMGFTRNWFSESALPLLSEPPAAGHRLPLFPQPRRILLPRRFHHELPPGRPVLCDDGGGGHD